MKIVLFLFSANAMKANLFLKVNKFLNILMLLGVDHVGSGLGKLEPENLSGKSVLLSEY